MMAFGISLNKYIHQSVTFQDIVPKEIYAVHLDIDAAKTKAPAYIKTYIPENSARQQIHFIEHASEQSSLDRLTRDAFGQALNIHIPPNSYIQKRFSFEFEGKDLRYNVAKNSDFESQYPDSIRWFLNSEPLIQASHHSIDSLAKQLKQPRLLSTLQANFDYVRGLENSNTRVLTDALSTLELQRASCNGKSRLFTALCRAQGIPSRVVGGIILENTSKRTSHLWSEIYYAGQWIPFDVLNKHFARLPAYYMQLYTGDVFLFRYSKGLDFDYQYSIEKKYVSDQTEAAAGINLWLLLQRFHISFNLLRTFLLLPLAALMIAIFRNVIGLKTYGILLPALIGLALVNVDLVLGITTFAIVIVVVSLLHPLLEKWSLLHIPKVSIILTCVIITLLVLSQLSAAFSWSAGEMVILLPIVIISITAERFAKTLSEEQFSAALKMLLHTFIVALCCYLIFKSKVLLGIFLSFPEQYLTILCLLLLLGRWIGMRLSEYRRFSPVV